MTYRIIGSLLLLNYAINSWIKVVNREPLDLLWLCPLTLLLASAGFLFKKQSLLVFAFIGSFYMSILWIGELAHYATTGGLFFSALTKFFFEQSWLQKTVSLFHVFLPFLCLIFIRRKDIREHAWIFNTLFAYCVLILTMILAPSDNINFHTNLIFIKPFILAEFVLLPLVFFLSQKILFLIVRNRPERNIDLQ